MGEVVHSRETVFGTFGSFYLHRILQYSQSRLVETCLMCSVERSCQVDKTLSVCVAVNDGSNEVYFKQTNPSSASDCEPSEASPD